MIAEMFRGLFSSVKEMMTKIDHFVEHHNTHSRPFVWTATAESIHAEVQDFVHVSPGQHTS